MWGGVLSSLAGIGEKGGMMPEKLTFELSLSDGFNDSEAYE